jgi:hypothetical protein
MRLIPRCALATSNADNKSRGFAAKVGEKVLGSVSAWGKEYQVLVEEDQEVHQMGGGVGL